jgi:GNAT superfamily N-acetyltransferase
MLDPSSPLFGRVAEEDGQVAGLAVCVLHEGTWFIAPVCYLEDLFIDPAMRGRGIGGDLIEDLLRLGRAKAWSRIYWNARESNTAARRLYDRFATADDHVRYRIDL